MNRSTSGARPALAVGVVFATVVFWHSVASAAPTTAWDQARVTEIAEQLAAAADRLYEQEYKAPESFMSEGDDASFEFMDRLRLLQHETRHLAASLKKGASAKATTGSVKRIEELNDDLDEYGRRMDMLQPVLDQIAAYENLVHQLTPYYGLKGTR